MKRLPPLLGLLLLLLLPLLCVTSVRAGVVVVDAFNQAVETTRLRVQFDYYQPEMIREVYDKSWSTVSDLTLEEYSGTEFWGQTMRGTSSAGFILLTEPVSRTWEVTEQTDQLALITITSESVDEPPVRTKYWFFADVPWFLVERTIEFSARPWTGAYQAYLPRVALLDSYRAIRYRDTAGKLQQRGYCITPCEQVSWDGRWVHHVGYTLGVGHSVAAIYPASVRPGTPLVRGFGPYAGTGWAAPLSDSVRHDTDETSRLMIAFSSSPDSVAQLDSLWTMYNSGIPALDAPRAHSPRPCNWPSRRTPRAGARPSPGRCRGRAALRWPCTTSQGAGSQPCSKARRRQANHALPGTAATATTRRRPACTGSGSPAPTASGRRRSCACARLRPRRGACARTRPPDFPRAHADSDPRIPAAGAA